MKEAIGSSYIFVICLVFIILFTGYIAISVNYNKAFITKDYLVSKIEDTPGGYDDGALREDLETYLTSQGYVAEGKCEPTITEKTLDGESITTSWNRVGCLRQKPNDSNICGACIYKKEIDSTAMDDIRTDRSYYKVYTFFKFDLPVVNVLMNFKIGGTTKYVFTD